MDAKRIENNRLSKSRTDVKRILWIDYIKGICILCVMIHHAHPLALWERFLSPFFLAAFFFANGYTFSTKNTWKKFIISKIRGLIIPLVSLSVINGLVGVIIKGIPFQERIIQLILERAPYQDTLWFFACLFTSSLFFYVILKISDNTWWIIFSSHILGMIGYLYISFIGYPLIWQIEIACITTIFLSWGFIYKRFENKIRIFADKNLLWILVSLLYIVLCLVYKNDVDMHEEQFGNIFIFVSSAFVGVFGLSMFCQRINKNYYNCKWLSYIGEHSIVYFAFQGLLMDTIRVKFLLKIGIFNDAFVCLGSVIAAVPILTFAAIILYDYFPCIIGKMSIKQNLDIYKKIWKKGSNRKS